MRPMRALHKLRRFSRRTRPIVTPKGVAIEDAPEHVQKFLGEMPKNITPIDGEFLNIQRLSRANGVVGSGSSSDDSWIVRDVRHVGASRFRVDIAQSGSNAILYVNRPLPNCRIVLAGKNGRLFMGAAGAFGGQINLGHDSIVEVGDKSTATNVRIMASSSHVTIGRDCMISGQVTINSAHHHGIVDLNEPVRRVQKKQQAIVINDHVWLGMHTVLVGGFDLGSGSIVASGAVLARGVPANTLIAGNPACAKRRNVTWSRRIDRIDVETQVYIAQFEPSAASSTPSVTDSDDNRNLKEAMHLT